VLTTVAAAFGMGLVFNATPGPVFAATLRHGVRGGFRPALAVQIGSLAGDALWAVLGLAGVGLLVRLDPLRVPIGVAGVAYLVWLAWDAWRAGARAVLAGESAAPLGNRPALQSGVLLSLTNPQNIGYWAALGSALGAVGVDDPAVGDYAAFFAGFMLSSIVWAFLLAAIVDRTLGGAGFRWARITYRACAILFLALALASLRDLWESRQRTVVVSGGRGELAALGDHHEHNHARRPIRPRRAVRRVKGPCRLEECAARRHDPFRLVVDSKTQLPLDDVPEDRPRMTMSRARIAPPSRDVQFHEQRLEPFERTRQSVSREFSRRPWRGCLRVDADGQQRGRRESEECPTILHGQSLLFNES
jgi:chemosensory pili system protein ChpE/L-lysine exporter family protein LysE/ArgO